MKRRQPLPELGTDRVLARILQSPESSLLFTPEFYRPELEPFRPCKVDGKPAIFHRWVDEDKVLLQLGCCMREDDAAKIKAIFEVEGYAPPSANIEKVRCTFALVEYTDGTVCKVEPEKVKFTDRRAPE